MKVLWRGGNRKFDRIGSITSRAGDRMGMELGTSDNESVLEGLLIGLRYQTRNKLK